MSAGNTGQGTPDGGDDPFAYLYRPEAGQAPPPAGPRQPSYNQVRPVGERTFGGQQGYRQQHSPDARYAAPETQPGGYGGGTPPPDRRRTDQDNRRNGLLIGAIAVVMAVVIGVGAAILFSGDDQNDNAGGDEPTAETSDDPEGEDEGAAGGDEEEPPEEPEADELPTADITQLPLTSGAALEATVQNSRDPSGSYIALLNRQGAGITWTFDFQGEPGMYRLYTGYSTISDGQTLSFSVNGTPREDPVNLKDYSGSDSLDTGWARTYNLVELVEGENTVQYSCTDSCDVVIDGLYVTEDRDQE